MNLNAYAIGEVSSYIDWDRLRDEYLLAVYDTPDGERRHLGKVGDDTDEMEIEEALKNAEQHRRKLHTTRNAQQLESVPDVVDSSAGALVFSVGPNDNFHGPPPAEQKDAATDAGKQVGVTDDGIDIPIYNYSRGNCPSPGDSDRAVPCAPDNLEAICSKYSGQGLFSACFNACRVAFCCIHGESTILLNCCSVVRNHSIDRSNNHCILITMHSQRVLVHAHATG